MMMRSTASTGDVRSPVSIFTVRDSLLARTVSSKTLCCQPRPRRLMAQKSMEYMPPPRFAATAAKRVSANALRSRKGPQLWVQ